MKEILIIGAGFSGAVLARELAWAGHKVVVADSRKHIAGNAYDKHDPESGVRYHVYGPHLFHTNNDEVFNWLSHFTDWRPYEHRVKVRVGNHDLPMPPNFDTFAYFNNNKTAVIDTLYRPYSRKMWGMELEEMDPTIIARLPMDPDSEDDRYFTDKHQCLPRNGYTEMFSHILDHENIELLLGCKIDGTEPFLNHFHHIFNCAPIDEWFNYELGELPYRSIKFHYHRIPLLNILPSATLNFSDSGKYTRVTEWNKLPGHDMGRRATLLTFEEPAAFDRTHGDLERYYPVKDVTGENRARYKEYLKIVPENMTFIGRCGQYVYINMDQAVNSALQTAKKFLANS